jgi:hypothetical protein
MTYTIKEDDFIDWTPDMMLEVKLHDPEDFLKVRETLTRIGIASKIEKTLYQSCHILHKKGKYYIVHFKELFALDGRDINLTKADLERRNMIAQLLHSWNLIELEGYTQPNKKKKNPFFNQITIIPYTDRNDWNLQPKYSIGRKLPLVA